MKPFLILENGVCLFPWNTIIKTTEIPLLSLDDTFYIADKSQVFVFTLLIGDVPQNSGKY